MNPSETRSGDFSDEPTAGSGRGSPKGGLNRSQTGQPWRSLLSSVWRASCVTAATLYLASTGKIGKEEIAAILGSLGLGVGLPSLWRRSK